MKEDTKTTCTPCEQNFERKVDELVKEGKAPTAREREEKEAEVEAAFSDRGKEKKVTPPGVYAKSLLLVR